MVCPRKANSAMDGPREFEALIWAEVLAGLGYEDYVEDYHNLRSVDVL